MEQKVLLAQLRALMERVPDFELYSPASKDHMVWLGQAHALVSRWKPNESISFISASNGLSMDLLRNNNIAKLFGTIQRAIADLELQVPNTKNTVFSAGDVYDFFQTMNKVISSAEKSIFIVDPYLDYTVFGHYLEARKSDVHVRLLLSSKVKKQIEALKPTLEKYKEQHGNVIEIKKSNFLHDRVIFIDTEVCWVLGQSLKDAAIKPTYLLPLSPDVISAKLEDYDGIWNEATEI